jgi:hypothetical protein
MAPPASSGRKELSDPIKYSIAPLNAARSAQRADPADIGWGNAEMRPGRHGFHDTVLATKWQKLVWPWQTWTILRSAEALPTERVCKHL